MPRGRGPERRSGGDEKSAPVTRMRRLWQSDQAAGSAPGSLRPNGFGLYGTSGNAAEWVEDCWNDFYHIRAEGRIAPDKVAAAQGASNTNFRVEQRGSFSVF